MVNSRLLNDSSLYIITIIKDNETDLLRTALSVITHVKIKFIHVFVDASILPVEEFLNNYDSVMWKKSIFIRENDTGIYNAMNQGLDVIPAGCPVMFLNAGDTFVKDIYFIPQSGCLIPLKVNFDNKYLVSRPIRSVYFGMPYCHQSLIFIKQYGMYFDESYEISSDYDFVVRYNLLFDKYHDQGLIVYQSGGFSDSNKFAAFLENLMIVYRYFGLLNVIKSLIVTVSRRLK